MFGYIGKGLAQGLVDTVPKEVERYRMGQHLENLGKQENLSPFQRYSGLLTTPGITPQGIQSGERLLSNEARANALNQQNAPKPSPSPFPQNQEARKTPASNIPSLTEEENFAKAQESYIPPTIEDRDAMAGDAYNQNPAFFNNDPQKAIEWADQKIAQEEKIATANQARHANLDAIQTKVVDRLGKQYERLGANVPSELYSKIEDEAIQATKPRAKGGKGMTEQQAMKEHGKKLDEASQAFDRMKTWGTWGITDKSANEVLRAMKSTQEEMEKLGATDLYAQQMQADNQTSPKFSYAIAQPVNKIPMLNNFIKGLPEIPTNEGIPGGKGIASQKRSIETTKEIAPILGEFLKRNENASPLAIGYEIEKKGYDLGTWLNWAAENESKLNLRAKQAAQLKIPQNQIGTMADYWLQSFSGIK